MANKYILEGHKAVPCDDILKWGRWFEKGADNRRVAETIVGTTRVSTVFLGIDHAFGGSTPMLFETMIFGGKHDEYQRRFATWEDAVKGHNNAVAMLDTVERAEAALAKLDTDSTKGSKR